MTLQSYRHFMCWLMAASSLAWAISIPCVGDDEPMPDVPELSDILRKDSTASGSSYLNQRADTNL